jgi:hypothetical protein
MDEDALSITDVRTLNFSVPESAKSSITMVRIIEIANA